MEDKKKIVSYWSIEDRYHYRCGHCGKVSIFTLFTEDVCLNCGSENRIVILAQD